MSRRPIPHPLGRTPDRPRALPWSDATEQALYGPGGFYHRPEGPAGHFRTSVHASPQFAAAIGTLLVAVDRELGHPPRIDLVDVGAGRGELVRQLGTWISANESEAWKGLSHRLRLQAVERAERPAGLPDALVWSAELPEDIVGLVVANEWLDNVPVDVVESAPDGTQRVLVVPTTGEEAPGGPIGLRDAAWLNRWWPLTGAPEGTRAEIGYPRDAAWAGVVRSLARGVAVAIDYGHLRADRANGAYATGTLTGYRAGRAVPPVPDGACDLTSHVAMDSCAAAGTAAGADDTRLVRQRTALAALGVTGARPPIELATNDPAAYVQQLGRASEGAELLDPQGLGAFWWLAQSVGMPLPALVAGE